MPRLFLDYDAELSSHIAWEERRRYVRQQSRSVSLDQARSMSEFAAYFPTASPGIIRGLAQSGYTPDHPVARFAITQDMLHKEFTTGSWSGQLGTQFHAPLSASPTPLPGGGSPPPSDTTTVTPEERVMKEAEAKGVYDPTTGLLVAPTDYMPSTSSDDRPAWNAFQALLDLAYKNSGKPVPFLTKGGTVYAADPSRERNANEITVSGYMEYPISPETGERVPVETIEGRQQLQSADYFAENAAVLRSLLDASNSHPLANEQQLEGAFSRLAAASHSSRESELTQGVENDPRHWQKYYEEARQQGINTGVFADIGNPGAFTRPVAALFDAPLQEFQGLIRNTYAAAHGDKVDWLESQSDLGVIIPRLVRGQKVDVGSGFFVDPDSAVARERRAREAERGKIGNHNITLGRILANQVTEPDTKPFQLVSGLVDGAVQVADPTSYALGKASNVSKAIHTFEPAEVEAGAFRSFRKMVHGPTVESWLDANPRLVERLATDSTPYEIAKLTNFKVSPEITEALSRAATTDEVRNVIREAVNAQRITQTTQLRPTWPTRIQNSWRESYRAFSPTHDPVATRFFQTMPSAVWDLEDPEQIARNTILHLKNARAPESDIADAYNLVARADTKTALRQAVMDVQSKVGGMLEHYGIADPAVRSWLTRTNHDTFMEHGRGLVDEIGSDVPTWEHMSVDGEVTQITGPHLPLEHISRYIHTPNIREIRRLTSTYPFLTARDTADFVPVLKQARRALGVTPKTPEGDLRLPFAFLDSVMSKVLKPLWLTRLAWPVRVIGEEQLRMSAAGLNSAFSGHPISYLALVIGSDENKLQRFLAKATPGIKPAYHISPSGELIDDLDALSQVTYRAHASWLDTPGTVRTNVRTIFTKDNPHELRDFQRSWADELSLISHDPVARRLLNDPDIEAVTDWLHTGSGREFRDLLMDAHPGNLLTRDQTRAYLDTITARVGRMTGGNTEILDAIRSGRFVDDEGAVRKVVNLTPEPSTSREFRSWITSRTDSAPSKVKGTVHARSQMGKTFGAMWDTALDQIMYTLMGAPTTTLSRSPAFRQYLWQRTAELLPWADVATRAEVLRNAREANLPSRVMRNLERASERNLAKGGLNLAEVDDLAKAHAIHDTKDLLYDLSQKSQASDILRNIVPFSEAWKEVLTRWTKLAFIRGPLGLPIPGVPVRRAQQLIEGLRGQDLGDFVGNQQGQGFFFQNEFGDEVFAYPGSQWLTNSVTGMPVPMYGSVQGLNMFGTIMPSLGPVAQIPVGVILRDKPGMDWWREQLLPFGGPGADDAQDIFAMKTYMPSWMKTGYEVVINTLQDHTDDRMYANNMMQVANYLYSTGKYGNTPEEQQRLLDDARSKAKQLYIIRASGQFLLPSSPSYEWMTRTKDGRNMATRVLAEEFHAMGSDYDEAVRKFMDTYGEDAIGAIVPQSRAVIFGAPTSLEGAQWVSENPSVRKKFPLTYGFFAPSGDFNQQAYQNSFRTGERETVTPREWAAMRDSLLGNYHYNRALAMLGDRADHPAANQRAWLEEQRTNIEKLYPLWGHHEGLAERPTTQHMIEELYKAVRDPAIARTPAGKALKRYLAARDQAQAQAEGLGYASFREARTLQPTRQWLADQAAALISRYPTFRQVWNLVLSREASDVEVTDAAA